MKIQRGDIILGVLAGDFGKPRPMLVVQTDDLNETHASVLVCPITSYISFIQSFRVSVRPSTSNGLLKPSEIMLDKVSAIARVRLTQKIGALSSVEMKQVERVLKYLFSLS